MAIVLYDKESNRRLFEITTEQLDQLIEALEEEDTQDHDYYIDSAVCEFLVGKVDEMLLTQLRALVGAPSGGTGEAVGGEPIEVAGDDEVPPVVDREEIGIEILWRQE